MAVHAFAHRPLSTSAAALTRLLLAVDLPLQGLRGKLENDNDRALSGRRALLAQQRNEAEQALDFIDSRRCQQLKTDILQWQFFQ